jgi:hypothetical protein
MHSFHLHHCLWDILMQTFKNSKPIHLILFKNFSTVCFASYICFHIFYPHSFSYKWGSKFFISFFWACILTHLVNHFSLFMLTWYYHQVCSSAHPSCALFSGTFAFCLFIFHVVHMFMNHEASHDNDTVQKCINTWYNYDLVLIHDDDDDKSSTYN